ncbi:MAG TPA: SMI1/KNR4 family protein [Parachlamydiaceae bacterium]|nr:SMI1/KNR4 family protein [Parachlamydiaceae bacterium]
MQHHIKDFYKQSSGGSASGNFHKVIALHQNEALSFEEIHEKVPAMPRGWFELAHLSSSDRIEFTRDFWITKLPYHPMLQEFLIQFFQSVEDIYIFVVQKKWDDSFDAHMVYSLKKEAGFFKGYPPVLEKSILQLQSDFQGVIFPKDYLAFLEIHNGFCKTTDCTGILNTKYIKSSYDKLQADIAKFDKELANTKGTAADPKSLIPFYESFGMPFFQCFFKDWYPEDEMGNVYYSGNSNTISDVKKKDPGSEAMAFATFSDWLLFYLETIS